MEEQRRGSIGSNWAGRLFLSLALAVSLWVWVTTSRDPETTRTFANIAPTTEQLADGLVIVGDITPVTVTVTGARSDITDLASSDISATIDLSSVSGPGTYNIQVETPEPENIWSATSTPRSVNLVIEQQATAVFAVVPTQSGNLGSNQQVEAIHPSASEVTVTGPASLIARIDRVELPVDIENRVTDFAGVFTPVSVDESGQIIAGVDVNPAAISATVEITARGKRVAVIAQITGEPASGFEVVDRLINPGTVLVDGPSDVIADMITVSTDVVDIQGAESDVTVRVSIVGLPEDVTILDPASGVVDVVVQIRQRGVQQPLPSQNVTVINLGAGLAATTQPTDVQVTVIGSEQELETLSPSSLIIQVDAKGLGLGTYQVQPTVILPPNMEWTSIEPAMIELVISEDSADAESATPSISGSPEST